MKTKMLAALSILASVCAFAPSASAEPPKKPNAYEYKFDDDSLLAANGNVTGPVITVTKFPRRERLLRPRVNFVPEMLKSVENM